MLGKEVTAKITKVVERQSKGGAYAGEDLLYAELVDYENEPAFIYGARRWDDYVEGKIVAVLIPPKAKEGEKQLKKIWIVAPGDLRPIRTDLFEYISKEEMGNYTLKCLYETSCGAVVCRCNGEGVKYLLIRNKRSQYWGWPKGHMERGENRFDTARREVYEETHLKIRIMLGFEGVSKYKLKDETEKTVYIYAAQAEGDGVIPQKAEVAGYKWLDYDTVLDTLKFQNDKDIFINAVNFLSDKGCFDKVLAPGSTKSYDKRNGIYMRNGLREKKLTKQEAMKSGVKKKQDKYFRTAKEKNEISYAQSDAFHLQKINTPEEDEAEKRKLNQIHIGV